jgi:hypothetical protein
MAETVYDPREDRGSSKGKVGMTKCYHDPDAAKLRSGKAKWRMAEAEGQTAERNGRRE